MNSFWEQFKRSTILQAVLTIMLWAAIIYLYICEKEIPILLAGAGMTTLGFYFGVKTEQIAGRSRTTKTDGT